MSGWTQKDWDFAAAAVEDYRAARARPCPKCGCQMKYAPPDYDPDAGLVESFWYCGACDFVDPS